MPPVRYIPYTWWQGLLTVSTLLWRIQSKYTFLTFGKLTTIEIIILNKKIRKFRTCTFNDDINLKPELLFIIYPSALVNIPLRCHMQLSRKYEIDLFHFNCIKAYFPHKSGLSNLFHTLLLYGYIFQCRHSSYCTLLGNEFLNVQKKNTRSLIFFNNI